MSGTDWGI